jgi:two-component system, chemotaxis family, CheB/CheR fusion protein
MLSLITDLTERRHSEQALAVSNRELVQALQDNQRAREQVEAALEAKDHFLAMLSHELRTPLTPVLMSVRMLERNPDATPEIREGLRMVDRNVRVECRLIDDLLDLTRIQRGKLEILLEPVKLHVVIQRALEVAAPDFTAKLQRLNVSLEAAHTDLQGDETRLQQVVWNLLKNASKYTPEYGEIRVQTRNEKNKVILEIKDNGKGIKPDVLKRIFEAFAEGDPEQNREFGGLGLGLAISKAIVDAHGGTLLAQSNGHGLGAAFTVELPASIEGRKAPGASI